MNRYVCESCGRVEAGGTYIEGREIILPVKGENITLTMPTRICKGCDTPVFDRLLDNDTLVRAYDIYRDRHSLESPEEIKTLRQRYGISQRNLALLLGWSEATINRYENGAVPDRAHVLALRTLNDPYDVRDLIESYGDRLPTLVRDQLRQKITDLIEESNACGILTDITKRARKGPDLLTGYRPLSVEKLTELILFNSRDRGHGGMYETKQHKMLFYADFAHFRETTVGITGEAYRRNAYGPTLHEYQIFELLVQKGDLECEQLFADDGSPQGRKYRALREPDMTAFTSGEIATIKRIYDKFANVSAKEISNLSHAEKAWIETAPGDLIRYEFALDLKAA